MGIYNNYRIIGQINALIKQIEPKIIYIKGELNYPFTANTERLTAECASVAVLMNEILEIINSSPRSVGLAPYYCNGIKWDIKEFAMYVLQLIDRAKLIM